MLRNAAPVGSRCNTRRLILWGGIFACCTAGAMILIRQLGPALPVRSTAALLAVVPGLIYIAEIIRAVRSLDELQRKIHLEAVSIAFAGTFLLTLLYPVLRKAQFLPEMPAVALPFVMIGLVLAGYAAAGARYR